MCDFKKICKLKSTVLLKVVWLCFRYGPQQQDTLSRHSSLTLWPLFSGCWEEPPPPLDPWSTADLPAEPSVFSSVSHSSCFCFFFFSSLVAKTTQDSIGDWSVRNVNKCYNKCCKVHGLLWLIVPSLLCSHVFPPLRVYLHLWKD